MEICDQKIKNLDHFGFKYIPMSSLERVILKFEDKNKPTNKEGMWDHISTFSSKIDDTEDKAMMNKKASHKMEPHEKDLTLDNVYEVLQPDEQMIPSEADSLFGPSKKKDGIKNGMRCVDDNQPSYRNQTSQQVLSTELKNIECNKSERKSSLDTSVHIVEVVNVADARVYDGSSKIQVTEQITANDDVNDEKSGIIECSSDNDKKLYTEILGLCNEIGIVNENDGSSVSHHGNEMEKDDSSSMSDKDKNVDDDYADIMEALEFRKNLWEKQRLGLCGFRSDMGMRPETPLEFDEMLSGEIPISGNDKRKTQYQVSKAEDPTEPHPNQMSKTERPQTRHGRTEGPPMRQPERPQTRHGRPEYSQIRDERFERPQTRQGQPETKDERPERPQTRHGRPIQPECPRRELIGVPETPQKRDERPERPQTRHGRPIHPECPQTELIGFPEPQKRYERPQTRQGRPECSHRRYRDPSESAPIDRSIWSEENPFWLRRFRQNKTRPDSQASRSSLETLASQAVKQVGGNQERIHKFLSRIYDIIIEPQNDYDYHDFELRFRRSNEFASLFVRNHLYQIKQLTDSIRTMRDNPIDIMAKVNSLFLIIMQGVRMYFRNIEKFIFTNNPDKLLELTDHILNAVQVCFERGACSKKEKAIVDIFNIINDIRYCIENVDGNGHLQKSFMEILKTERQQKLDNENIKEQVDQEMKLKQHEISKESKENSKKDTRDASEEKSTFPVKFKCLREEDFNEKSHKMVNKYDAHLDNDIKLCPTDKIWSKNSEEKMRGTANSQKPIQNVRIDKEIAKKSPKSAVRMNVYGYPMKGPFDKPKSPYVIPKEAKPEAFKRLSLSRRVLDENLHYKNAYMNRVNLQKSKTMQKPGLHSTKSTSNGIIKNTVHMSKLYSAKSTVVDVKKSSLNVASAKQREIEAQNQHIVNKEDSESEQSSDNSSIKSSKCGTIKKLRFDTDNNSRSNSSRISVKSGVSGCSSVKSDKSSLKSDKNSSKVDQNCPKIDKGDKIYSKSDNNHQKIDHSSQELDKNPPRTDSINSKINEMLKIPQDDFNGFVETIQRLTMEKFDAMIRSMISQHVPSKDAKRPKAEKIKKSVRRVTSDVEPLKKPKSVDSQHSMIERLAPNVQLMLIKNDDDSNENDEEEVLKPSSMTNKSDNEKPLKSDGSASGESSQDDESDETHEIDFSKYTSEELREMAIKEQQIRLERIKRNPLHFNDDDEPKTVFDRISDKVLDKLIDGLMTESNVDENELMKKFIKSELEC